MPPGNGRVSPDFKGGRRGGDQGSAMHAPKDEGKTPTPKPGVLDIAPYVGGRAAIAGVANPIKLSSNKSALGPSPLAREAYDKAAKDLEIYPEGSARILREAIGETYGLDAARIVCGNGSDELLSMLAEAYLRPGDEVLFSAHAFIVYRIAALANSAGACRRAGKKSARRCRCYAGARYAEDAPCLSRQSQQSHRLLSRPG